LLDTRVLKLRVDEPVILTQKPVEVRALESPSVVVTVRLVMAVTDPVRYATALVSKARRCPASDRRRNNPLSGTQLNALRPCPAVA
jgi:hypothetical protein